MKHIVVYVHGKGGSPAEAEHYKSLFPDSEVIGFDYRAHTPWEAKEDSPPSFASLRQRCASLTLIDAAYLISPVADMEKLIRSMMAGADVTEQELAEKQEIPTPFGETLSWRYLCYVREHPVSWRVPTRILYGARDNLTDMETISDFARKFRAELTVMLDGEHWFHTEEQLQFLNAWILNGQTQTKKEENNDK